MWAGPGMTAIVHINDRVGNPAGEGLIVYYDYASGKSCEIPPAIVAAITALED